MGPDPAANGVCVGNAGPVGVGAHRRCICQQIVRPTGLIDPPIQIRPTENQIDDLMAECQRVVAAGGRALVTTLTKKMAESLTEYLSENGLRVQYLHSDVDTLERIEILRDLRLGNFDILVGINLLREGLDIPECMLVAILDADKEGFLRNKTSLIQTIGRAARNVDGIAVLYADVMTKSINAAIEETNRRRAKQVEYNTAHGITPSSIKKNIREVMSSVYERGDHVNTKIGGKPKNAVAVAGGIGIYDADGIELTEATFKKYIAKLHDQMVKAAENLEFETAAKLRDDIKQLEAEALGV